jgi:oxalate decarboxylase/phosphoglucose isomerase-like protein (cupin superfamily)
MTTKAEPVRMKRTSAYAEWQAGEGIPVYDTFFIEDLKKVTLGPWQRTGGLGAFINLEGAGDTNNCYVAEVPIGGSTRPMRHLYEEMVYVLQGSGATTISNGRGASHTFEWQAGSLFAIPMNTTFQHFNTSGTALARYVAVISAPVVMNLFHNTEFVFNAPFDFTDRYNGEQAFDGDGELWLNRRGTFKIWETNFVPNADTFQLYKRGNRGAGGSYLCFELAHNTMVAHISEFPVGTYKKAHRHGPGANVIILGGKGFTLLWEDGKWDERVKVDWKPGSIVVPPSQWFHQHFNSGDEPARYLALRWGSNRYEFSTHGADDGRGATETSVKEGGNQIEYADEDPEVHRIFEAELKASGATCRMKSMVPGCTGIAPDV